MVAQPLPRYVIPKKLSGGRTGYYFNVPMYYRNLGCPVGNEPLGTNYIVACGEDGEGGRAAVRNGEFDEWLARHNGDPIDGDRPARFGTVDWIFREYKRSDAYLEKVSVRSRPDYERTMRLVANIVTKKGDRVGSRMVKAITPRSTDKISKIILKGRKGPRPRQVEKAVSLCSKAWRVVRRLFPDQFDSEVPDPWDGVTLETRTKARKPAATREQVYTFAWGCVERGEPEAGAAAVICFEWLQRPENVLAGYLRWTDYRSPQFPDSIRIEHHKTGEMIWHPLQETTGETIEFYPEAEAVLAKLPRRGIPMILLAGRDGQAKPYSFGGMQKIVQRMRVEIGLPKTFTLDACRHGGMTELEEAELTDGQGRALSAHRSQQSYEGYAKRTLQRALGATRKRRAHVLANSRGTSFQNGRAESSQNDGSIPATAAKAMS